MPISDEVAAQLRKVAGLAPTPPSEGDRAPEGKSEGPGASPEAISALKATLTSSTPTESSPVSGLPSLPGQVSWGSPGEIPGSIDPGQRRFLRQVTRENTHLARRIGAQEFMQGMRDTPLDFTYDPNNPDAVNGFLSKTFGSTMKVIEKFQIPQQMIFNTLKRIQNGEVEPGQLAEGILNAVKGKEGTTTKELWDKALDELTDNGLMSPLIKDAIKDNPAYKALSFGSDIVVDPLFVLGSGQTKFGRVARVVKNADEMGTGIKLDSRAAKVIAEYYNASKPTEEMIAKFPRLAGTVGERVDLGQTALITVLGRPAFKGRAIVEAANSATSALGKTKVVSTIRKLASNRTGNEALDEILFKTQQAYSAAAEEGVKAGVDIGKQLRGVDQNQVNLVSKILDEGLDYEVVHTPEQVGKISPKSSYTAVKFSDVVGKKSFVPIDASEPVSGVFFHGTAKELGSSKELKTMPGTGGTLGRGVYLTDDPSVASFYAKTAGPPSTKKQILTVQLKDAKLLDVSKPVPLLPELRSFVGDTKVSTREVLDGLSLSDQTTFEKILSDNGFVGFLIHDIPKGVNVKSSNVVKIFKGQESILSPAKKASLDPTKILDKPGFLNMGEKAGGFSVGVSPEVGKVIGDMRNQFQFMRDTERELGVLRSEYEHYFPRIITTEGRDAAKATAQEVSLNDFNILPRGYKLQAAKERKTAEFTLEEFNKLKQEQLGVEEFFTKDPAVAMAVRKSGSMKALAQAEMWDDIATKFAVHPADAARWDKGIEITGVERLKGLKFDRDIAEHLGRINSVVNSKDNLTEMYGAWKKMTDWWKGWTLGVFPEYHFRNSVSNFWNNWLSGVRPDNYFEGYRVAKGMDGTIETVTGAKFSYNQVQKWAKKYGVEGAGWYGAEVPEEIANRVAKGQDFSSVGSAIKTVLRTDPTAPDAIAATARKATSLLTPSRENQILKLGFAVGKGIENNARMAHFVYRLKQGDTPVQAAMSVAKYLFDYGDLTTFEKHIKQFLPFMKWTKENVPLQVVNLFKQPWKYTMVSKGRAAFFEQGEVNQMIYPEAADFIRENVPIRLRTTEQGDHEYFLLGGWWPGGDIQKLLNPIDTTIGMMHPLINQLAFQNRKVLEFASPRAARLFDQEQQEQVKFIGVPMTREMSNRLRFMRLASSADRFYKAMKELEMQSDSSTTPTNPLTKVLTGIKTYQTSPAKDVLYRRVETRDALRRRLRKLQDMQEQNVGKPGMTE